MKQTKIGNKKKKQEMEQRVHKYKLRGQWRKQSGQERKQRSQDSEQCGQEKEESGSVIEQDGQKREQRGQKREQRGQKREQRGQKREQRGQKREQRGQKREQRGQTREQRGQTREQRGQTREQRGQERQLPYAERLKTFDNWPVDPRVAPEEWAKAGFTWTGIEDMVHCAVCDLKLRGIQVVADPWRNHAMGFPPCEFLKKVMGTAYVMKHQIKGMGEDGRPYKINELKKYCKIAGVQHEYKELAPYCVTHKDRTAILLSALYDAGLEGDPDIKTIKALKAKLKREEEDSEESGDSFDERYETFANWPEDHPLPGGCLADAGFSLDGQTNQVHCEECDLVYEWKEGPQHPWDKHASKYPPCHFIKYKRGQKYIDQHQIKGTSKNGQLLKIKPLREYCKVAGLRYKYSELVKDCVTYKDRTDKLLTLLREAGLKGDPDMEKCKALYTKRNGAEIVEAEKEDKHWQEREQRVQGRRQRWQERQKRKQEGEQRE